MTRNMKLSCIIVTAIFGVAVMTASHAAHAKCYSSTATPTNASKAGAISYARS